MSVVKKILCFSLFGLATIYAQTTVLHVGSEEQLHKITNLNQHPPTGYDGRIVKPQAGVEKNRVEK
jgi:hypothetical protein